MKTILAVSTDEQLLARLQKELQPHGFEVTTIADHQQLFGRIKEIDPYILIIDFIMEDDNAAALCHKLKSDPATKDLHIILLSEFPQMEQFAAKFGSFAMVKKPVNIHDILISIEHLPEH